MKKLYVVLMALVFCLTSQVKSQTYCTPTFTGTGTISNFYVHFLSFSFGEIYTTYTPPWGPGGPIYFDYTSSAQTNVVAGHTYPLWVIVGNGGNTQTVAVWIDYNHNGTFETSERILVKTDTANLGDHNIRANITIPANAYIGTTRLRIGTIIGLTPPSPCNNSTYPDEDFMDFGITIKNGTVQSYSSASCNQPVVDEVTKASANNQILQISVNTNTDGTLSPLSADTFYLSTLGSTNPADITDARLFYTGKNPEFTTSKQVGPTVTKPSAYFKINGKQTLEPGINYFWLTYSVTSSAIIGNALDARCNGVYIRTKRVPSIIDPTGVRNVGYCVSKGNKSMFVYINRVQLGNIDNAPYGTYYPTTGYTNYTNYVDTMMKPKYSLLSVTTGNGVNTNKTRAWIDYNGDGFFDNATELVLFDSIFSASATTPNYGPVSDSFKPPLNAPCGETRMRIITQYFPTLPPYRINAKPCDNPVEVGEVEDYKIVIGDAGQPISSFNTNIACLGSATGFVDKSYTFGSYKITSWLWDFGDGDTSHSQYPVHTYKKAGVYTVTLTTSTNYSGNIPSVIKKAVKVNDPQANFSVSSSSYNTPVLFVDETSGGITTGWYWTFGDPASAYNNFSNLRSPTHIFDTVGHYQIMFVATTEGGCKDTVYKTIYIDSTIAPVADFTASTFAPYFDQVIQLVDISVNSPVSWHWYITPSGATFKNGSTATSRSPSIVFNTIGTFNVKLVITNSKGKDSITKVFTTKTYTKPVADFSANPTSVRAGQIVSFLDQSTNDPTFWLWTFGDGDTSNVQYPDHIYSAIGNYTVNLTAKNPAGSSSAAKAGYIKVINEYQVCDQDAPVSNLFSGLIFDSGGKGANYKNNSDCGFLIYPPCSGPITLSFTMFDYNTTDIVKVYDGVDNKGIPLFSGSGYTGTVIPPNLTAYSGAMYIEEITGSGTTTAGFAAFWTAVPNIKPVATFSMDTIGYIHGPLNFINTTKLGTGNVYYWDYNNDKKYEDTGIMNGRYVFNKTGYDTITLLAINCKGSSLAKRVIHIIDPTSVPIADFSSDKDTALQLEMIQFFDESSMGPTSWKWQVNPPCPFSCYFANGTSDTSQNPVIQFFDVGSYDITLTSTNSFGAGTPVTKIGKIYIKSKSLMCNWPFEISDPAGRIYDSGDEPGGYGNNENCGLLIDPCAEKVYLGFTSFDFAPGDYLRVYDGKDNKGKPLHPGSGFSGSVFPTKVLVANSGSLYIEEITNSNTTATGFIADYWTKPVAMPKASFVVPDTAYTGGYITYFDNTSTGKIDSSFWDYNYDGNIDDTAFNGKYRFTTAGLHYAQLIVKNCSGSSSFAKYFPVVNQIKKPKANFSADVLRGDTSDIITLLDLSKNGPFYWKWRIYPPTFSYVDQTDSLSTRPHVKFSKIGYYDIMLIAKNGFGSDTILKKSFIQIFSYCIPSVTTLLTNFGISNFVLNDISNPSACGMMAYTNFSKTISTSLELGGTYNFEISSILPQNYSRKIWIDYNQDGIFDDTSELAAANLNSTVLLWTGTFKIPSTALYGSTRLRIGVGYAGYANKPCGPNYFGEFEDYKINITEDHTPPVITLLGYNPALTEITYSYVDSGAVAWDAVDGDISSKMTIVSNVDTNKVGVYKVKYNVSDNAGNHADEVIRTVYVTPDKTKPVINLKGKNPMSIEVYYSYKEPGATAIDNKDGNVSANLVIQSTVDTSRVDTYMVFYSAYDYSGNYTDQVKRIVYVVDTIRPVIHLKDKDTIYIPLAPTYKDSGAYVTDNYYKGIVPTAFSNVKPNVKGWYIVRYNAFDHSGNNAFPVTRHVKVGTDSIGIGNIAYNDEIDVYPNPTKGTFNINYRLENQSNVKLEISNQLGQIVKSMQLNQIYNKNYQIDLSKEMDGVYFVKSIINDKVYLSRIVLVK